jgi:hypothetical protein
MYACDNCNHEMIKHILSKGGNPNSHKDLYTCLMALCCTKCPDNDLLTSCAKLLLENGAKVNSHDRHHMTPLLYACQAGQAGLASLLISHGADVNKQDLHGWTSLCYAASLGNLQLIDILKCNGAKTTIATHLGDTPSTIALSKGLMSVVSAIDGSKSSNDKLTSSQRSPHHDERVGLVYGDLELFLAGLQLSHLASLFQDHEVKFTDMLSMSDGDLEDIGISQVGIRKKILEAITDLHKTQWKMPQEPLVIKRGLSLQEYSLVLLQLCSHIDYVCSSTRFVLNQTTHEVSSPVAMAMESCEQEELINQVQNIGTASRALATAVATLEGEVFGRLGRPLSEPSRLRGVVKAAGWVCLLGGTAVAIGYWCFHSNSKLVQFLSMK